MDATEYANIARLEDDHWWYVGVRELVTGCLATLAAGRRLDVLDAGCGTGRTLAGVVGQHKIVGCDFATEALRIARQRLPALARSDVGSLPFEDQVFDCVLSLDVLYHLGVADELAALSEIRRVLRPGGGLLLQLPAFESLRGSHDVAVHTRRRYRRREVATMLARADLEISQLSYRNCLLFPLAAGRRLAGRLARDARAGSSDVRPLPAAANRVFTGLLRWENRKLLAGRSLPWGLSLFALAKRP